VILTLVVGLLAGLGAVSRYTVDEIVGHWHDADFPFGTLLVNVSGSFVLGLVTGLATHHGLPEGPTVALSAGFCGGYTTWSTYAYESVTLAESGELLKGVGNLGISVVAGLGAAAAGFGLALL
jgi:fluoride exporter